MAPRSRKYKRKSGVWVPRAGAKHFAYSDGEEVENRLLRIVSSARDVSVFSKELAEAVIDWPSLYHLSAARANLLRPFATKLAGKKVLEIGAGCGAITRFLGESGAEVLAVEGSFARACIAHQRTRDLPNVVVVCDDHQNFSAKEEFDFVVVIGVLEYARTITSGIVNPELAFLKRLVPLLSDTGALIIAIENQLGAKYFAGAPEDHIGKAFYGINDQYGPDTAVTFGRKALSGLLEEAGLAQQAWYYPFPDYKLTNSIVSDDCLRELRSLAPDLIAANTVLDPQRPRNPTFSLETIWGVLARNDLINEMANSFLVFAKAAETESTGLTDAGLLAWHYSASHRHPAFMREVRFKKTNNEVTVLRRSLTKDAPPHVPLSCSIVDEPYVVGTNWWSELVRIVNRPGWGVVDLVAWCQFWQEQLTLHMKSDAPPSLAKSTLIPGRYIDVMAFNLVATSPEAGIFIDQEWRLDEDIELGFVIYRNLRASLLRITGVAEPGPGTPLGLSDLIRAVTFGLGMPFSADDLRRFGELEWKFQRWVQGDTKPKIEQALLAALENETLVRHCPDQQLAAANEDLPRLVDEVAVRDRRLVAANEELKRVVSRADSDLRILIAEIENRDRQLAAADGEVRRLMAEVVDRDQKLVGIGEELQRMATQADSDLRRAIGEIQECERQLVAADREVRRLMAEVVDRDQNLVGVGAELQRMAVQADSDLRRAIGEIQERERQLVAADREVRRLMAEVVDRDQNLVGVGAELQRMAVQTDSDLRRAIGEIQERERQLVAADTEVRRLMADVVDRDQKLVGAGAELQRIAAQVADRDQKLVGASKELQRMTAQADSELRRTIGEIQERDKLLAQVQLELRDALEEVGGRDRRLLELERRIHEIEMSTTWRITAPMRTLFAGWRDALSRLKKSPSQ